MKLATIIKLWENGLKELFKINGPTIEGLINQVLFARLQFQKPSGFVSYCRSHFENEERLPQDIALAQC